MTAILFNIGQAPADAKHLADLLGAELGELEQRQFPDQEHYLRLHQEVAGKEVIFFCSLFLPEAKLLPLLFLAAHCRSQGARQVGLITPYLSYMRQDQAFNPGEVVTSRSFANLLSAHLDYLVTLDPHLHRYPCLSEIYQCRTQAVAAAPAISAWLAQQQQDFILIGPDQESQQWVEAVATPLQMPWLVLHKDRYGDRDVRISQLNLQDYPHHRPVVLDDIISSGKTMLGALEQIPAQSQHRPLCIGIHGVFADHAYAELSSLAQVITCNSLPHPSNQIDIYPLLAEATRQCWLPHAIN
ncbi:ribose-phosphate diphosphokinase [Balneatrix alpica]|uniref:ribose-phosphate diphosphokinase n=1 Tax=Balneatrix alpica TaxID=75684 RepID=UPI00273A14DE|nr:ribose-phosphate diphosphokinase [Balneatrix alpica]